MIRKKRILFSVIAALSIVVSACGNADSAKMQEHPVTETGLNNAEMPEAAAKIEQTAADKETSKPADDAVSRNADDIYPDEKSKGETNMVMKIDQTVVDVSWEDNAAVQELKDLAAPGLSIEMSGYGGFEQVGTIGKRLTQNDKQITTQAGDIVLYSGDQLVVFYGSNSWSYTRLGKLDLPPEELKQLLGNADVTITLSVGEK